MNLLVLMKFSNRIIYVSNCWLAAAVFFPGLMWEGALLKSIEGGGNNCHGNNGPWGVGPMLARSCLLQWSGHLSAKVKLYIDIQCALAVFMVMLTLSAMVSHSCSTCFTSVVLTLVKLVFDDNPNVKFRGHFILCFLKI